MSDFPTKIAFLLTENNLIMCSEASWELSPNVLRSLMLYNFKKIGGFWFLCLPHAFTGEIVLAV